MFNMVWRCPFARSKLAIENSIWLQKSTTDKFFGEDTNHLSNNTPAGVPRKHYKALRQTSVKTRFLTLCLICHVISRLALAWAIPII